MESTALWLAGVAAAGFGLTTLIRAGRRSEELKGRTVRLHAYDPGRRRWTTIEVERVAPGVYADPDAEVIALVPTDAPPDRVCDASGCTTAYTVVKVGNFYGYVDPIKAVGVATSRTGLDPGEHDFPSLITRLYAERILPAQMRIRPDTTLYLYMDPRSVSHAAIDLYDHNAEQSLVGVAAMTGQTVEFEKFVKTLIELEREKQRSSLTKWAGIGVVVFLAGLAITMLSSILR